MQSCLYFNNLIMKNLFGQSFNKNEREVGFQRNRLKTSPGGQSMNEPVKKFNQQTIIVFGYDQYPFPNEENIQTSLLKTIVNLDLNTQKLEKVIKLTHPNIIGLRKIVRSSPRQIYQENKNRSYYSFYYEIVQYNLRDLANNPNKNIRLFNSIRSINLKQILMNVTEYLKQAGIYYTSRIQDIGVHIDGTIKIYIPPLIVFDSSYNPNIHRTIIALADWWENLQNQWCYNKFKKDKTFGQLQPPRLSDNGDLELDDPSMKSSTLQRQLGQLLDDQEEEEPQNTKLLKQSSNSHYSQITKIGSIQLQKFKKLDEQVRCIRSRLNEKTKRKHKQSDTTQQKKQGGKSKSSLNLFESSNLTKSKQKIDEPVQKFQKIQNPYFSRQPIQQNIHCINIYNHNTTPHITPNVFNGITSPKYMQKKKNYPVYYDPNLDPDFFRDQDQEYSQDTYDIQFQSQFELPNTGNNNNYRHTLVTHPERQLSQYSEHCPKKNRQNWGNQSKIKNKQQIVPMCNKNVTQSAGPLQFKSFVNKIIKPQFLAKKSNIYEDPGEDGEQQSQKQLQKSKRRQDNCLKRGLNSSNSNFRNYSIDKGFIDQRKISNKSVTEFASQQGTKNDIKRISSQHDFNANKGKLLNVCDTQIEQKVKKALEKTKNAIALLNRVKSNKNIVKNFSSQQN